MLACPACRGELDWSDRGAQCRTCERLYPVRDRVASFLVDAPGDAWAEAESAVARALRDDPDLERRLLGSPLAELAPADRFFRALALEERGDFEAAAEAAAAAEPDLYTPDMLASRERTLTALIEEVSGAYGLVVDVASGRGTLVDRLAREVDRPVVATDVSPTVLARMRARGLADGVLCVACDARRMPFDDGAAGDLTSFLGLPNIRQPGPLLSELRRVTGGSLIAITHLYPEGDDANGEAIRALGLERMLYRDALLAELAAAGWRAEVRHSCLAEARPTPRSELLDGAGIDGLPVAPTVLEWCVVVARPA